MKIPPELLEKLSLLNKETPLIAIDGRGGSGKSTLADLLHKQFPKSTIVHLDDFAYPNTDRERLLEQVIKPLKSNMPTKYQRYDWGTKQLAEWYEIQPGQMVIIEGVSTFHELLNSYYDFRIWLECSAEVGFQRGLKRDLSEHKVDTKDKWLNEWMPEEKKYINEQKPQDKTDFTIYTDK